MEFSVPALAYLGRVMSPIMRLRSGNELQGFWAFLKSNVTRRELTISTVPIHADGGVEAIGSDGRHMKARSVKFEMFRGVIATWPELFEQAAAFATRLGPDCLISISHSEDKEDGVVAVWFWDDSSHNGPTDEERRD